MKQLTSRTEINHDEAGHQTRIQAPDSFELSVMAIELCYKGEYLHTGCSNSRGMVNNVGSLVNYSGERSH